MHKKEIFTIQKQYCLTRFKTEIISVFLLLSYVPNWQSLMMTLHGDKKRGFLGNPSTNLHTNWNLKSAYTLKQLRKESQHEDMFGSLVSSVNWCNSVSLFLTAKY